jgi:hypothetical protein
MISHEQFWTHKTHHGPDSGEANTFPPYIIICVSMRHLHPNGFLSWDSQGGVPKLSSFGLLGFCEVIILCSNFGLGWGLKQTCNFPWELSNDVSHSTCTHRGRVDSWVLVVGSQIASLTPDPSFYHNVCSKCPHVSPFSTSTLCYLFNDIKNARCFDLCNWTLKFRES